MVNDHRLPFSELTTIEVQAQISKYISLVGLMPNLKSVRKMC